MSSQRADTTKKAEVKTSENAEKASNGVQKVAATKKAEVKAADTKKADKDMSEAEWNKAYDEAVKHYEEYLKKVDKNDNEEWSKIVEERLIQRSEESARHANDVVDEDHMTEEEWNKLVEERGRERYEETLRHANDRPDTDSTTETDVEIQSDAE